LGQNKRRLWHCGNSARFSPSNRLAVDKTGNSTPHNLEAQVGALHAARVQSERTLAMGTRTPPNLTTYNSKTM